MSVILLCDGLHKIYNPSRPNEVRALFDVNLEIERGSFTLLRGPSGSGKTTLLGILGALDRPSRGRVMLDGTDLARCSGEMLSTIRRKRIGFVFQNFNLLPRLPAWENVSMPLIPLEMAEQDRRKKALSLLDKLGLGDRTHHAPEELSGGEQQRVAVARALINDPDIVILDEPTSNIDAEASHQLLQILTDLKEEGRTIIASSHDEDLYHRANKIFDLRRGSLGISQTPSAIGERPAC
jgi:putative ABC transport system ATP-binding protein